MLQDLSTKKIDENGYFFGDVDGIIKSLNRARTLLYADFNPARPMNWFVIQGLLQSDIEFLVPIHPNAPNEVVYQLLFYSIKEEGAVSKKSLKTALKGIMNIHSKLYFSSIAVDLRY